MQNLQSKLRIIIASLLVLALILGFQFSSDSERAPDLSSTAPDTRIDFFVTQGVITRWSVEGIRESVTTAEYAEHFESRKLLELDYPYSVGYTAEGEVAHTLSSVSGIYLDDNSRIDLAGTVELHHNPDTEKDTALYTEQLSYYPETGLAQTDLPVEFLNSQGQTNAEGMEFYTQENRVELLSKVRGTYVPSE